MDLSHTQSRSSNSSSFPLNNETQDELVGLALVNLLISESTTPLHGAQIVFKTMNLTKTITKNNDVSSNNKPCLLTSLFLFSKTDDETSTVAERLLEEADQLFEIEAELLPQTTCVTHGNVGFLPLKYVRLLPEYTCAIRTYPVKKVVHKFEDCVLLFPHDDSQYGEANADYYSRSLNRFKGGFYDHRLFMKNCYKCLKKLRENQEMFFYRDKSFCSPQCRYVGHVAHCLREKMMKDVENKTNN